MVCSAVNECGGTKARPSSRHILTTDKSRRRQYGLGRAAPHVNALLKRSPASVLTSVTQHGIPSLQKQRGDSPRGVNCQVDIIRTRRKKRQQRSGSTFGAGSMASFLRMVALTLTLKGPAAWTSRPTPKQSASTRSSSAKIHRGSDYDDFDGRLGESIDAAE
jgi:hypothetical protein